MARDKFQSADRIIKEGSRDVKEVTEKIGTVGKVLEATDANLDEALLAFIAGEEDNTAVRHLRDLLNPPSSKSSPTNPAVKMKDPPSDLPLDDPRREKD